MSIFNLDPKIEAFEARVYEPQIVQDVLKDKYLQPGETPDDMFRRVANAIAHSSVDSNPIVTENAFYELLSKRLFLPGGRILAGAGTEKEVTLMNCYVNETLKDTIKGISEGKTVLWVTSAMGGGLGTDFSTLRPKDALVRGANTGSSGAVSFMDTFNEDGRVIRSAGDRRAAQMGTLSDTHPDLPTFIKAKGEGLLDGSKKLAEFNVSVLISDAFKSAVDDDEEWPLYFHIPPKFERSKELQEKDFEDDSGVQQYVYEVWRARDLWNLITEYTYKFSDPGVIFIDRVNEWNNLGYCETIRCTNPCGEQPLPPNGTCNLGAINLANVVRHPFTKEAEINFELLAEIAKWGVRFLDNVIDVTKYPLEAQRDEEFAKRRIGLGITSLGTMFAELRVRYGSPESVRIARQVMKTICNSAYEASIELAKERGSFPLFQDIIIEHGFIKNQMEHLHEDIVEHGLRNGVILTIAPVGTGSIIIGNLSSGLEPEFSLQTKRRVRKANTEEFTEYMDKGYTLRFYEFCTGQTDIPDYMVTSGDLTILEHIQVQAALQEWVDASTSKTINIREDMPYEEFVGVYELAYDYGLKGTTTYRPSEYRQSILTDVNAKSTPVAKIEGRPDFLEGSTYKLKDWPSLTASVYITINYLNGKPHEIFFATKDAKYADWMTALTLMISGIMRSSDDPSWIVEELKQVVSTHDTQWYKGKFYGSLPARIGHIIEQDFLKRGMIKGHEQVEIQAVSKEHSTATVGSIQGEKCPRCTAPTFYHQEGCKKCSSCGYSAC